MAAEMLQFRGKRKFDTIERAENMMWFYAAEGRQTGPVSQEQLAELVRSGQIAMESLVWREGMASWQPLREVQASIPALAGPAGAAPGAAPRGASSPAGPPPPRGGCSRCGYLFSSHHGSWYRDPHIF